MRVEAQNQASIASIFTNLPSASTLENPPNQPAAAAFSNILTDQLQANWTANGNPPTVSYTAILSSAPSPSTNGLSGNHTVAVSSTSAVFTGLTANTLYYVDVKATSTGGSSAFLALGSAATLANAPSPAAPSNIQTNQITANWGANGNPAGTNYQVEASTSNSFSVITTVVNTASLSAPLGGLSGNTQYFMQVRAFNQASVPSAFTALASASTLENVPNAPSAAAFSNLTPTSLQANWTAVGNPADVIYTAILSSAPSPSTNGLAGNQTIPTTNFSATFSNLSPNVLYFVEVKATSTGGSSAFSSLGSIATFANAPISASPTNIQTNQITANWGTNGNAAGTTYLVQASTDPSFASVTTGLTVTGSSATLTGLTANTLYFMQVRATNQNAVNTVFTGLPSASTLQNVPNAAGVAAFTNVVVTQLQANWTANGTRPMLSTPRFFQARHLPARTDLRAIKSVTTSSTFVTFSGLSANVLYFVEVKATSTGGSSAYSSLGSVPTLANAPVSGTPTNIQPNQITAHWGANANSAGTVYLAQAATDAGFNNITVGISTTGVAAVLTGLSPQTTYFMRVQAQNQASIPTTFTTLPTAITLGNPPNTPQAAGFTSVTASQIVANWLSNGNSLSTSYSAILSTAASPSTNGLSGNITINTGPNTLTATFTALQPNTTYFAQVKAINSGGVSSAYADLGFTFTLANLPTSIPPTNIQTNQITANWGANGNPAGTSYLVQASQVSNFSSIDSAVTTSSTSAALTGLLESTPYFFQVQAINRNGIRTSFVALPQATTLGSAPNVPSAAGFTAVGAAQITANWTANGNPAGTLYNAVLSTSPSPSTNGLSGNKTNLHNQSLCAIYCAFTQHTLLCRGECSQLRWRFRLHQSGFCSDARQSTHARQSNQYWNQPDHRQLGNQRQSRRNTLYRSGQRGFRIQLHCFRRHHGELFGDIDRSLAANHLLHAGSGLQSSGNSNLLRPFTSGGHIDDSAECSQRGRIYGYWCRADHRQLDGQRKSRGHSV